MLSVAAAEYFLGWNETRNVGPSATHIGIINLVDATLPATTPRAAQLVGRHT